MSTISSRLSIPLLLIVFVALLVPLTARAATVLSGAEDCKWYQMVPLPGLMSCPDRNRAKGFSGDGTVRIQLAPATAPVAAPAQAIQDPSIPKWAGNLSPQEVYKNSSNCREFQGWTCDDEKQRLFYQSGGKSITPTASPYTVQKDEAYEPATTPLPTTDAIQQYRAQERALYNAAPSSNTEPKDNWDLQGTRETPIDEAIQQYRAGERASYNSNPLPTADAIEQYRAQERALYNVAPSANVEPKDNWDLQGTREPLDNWDLQGKTPATRALTPLQQQVQKYQAQFNNASERPTGDSSTRTALTDAELQRVGKSCAEDASAGPYQQCIMNTVNSLQGGITPADALRVQQYVQSQESSAQTTVRDSAPAYVSPYNDARDPSDFYTYMDNCDKKYGTNSTDANICKEPILREMGIAGPAQAPTPVYYYGQYAPVEDYSRLAPAEDIARFNEQSDQPKTYATGVGWIDRYILRIPDRTKYELAPDASGGVTVVDRNADSVVDNSRYPVTDSSGQSTNMYTVAQEDTGPGPATGWLLSTQNFFSNLFGGERSLPEPQPYTNPYVKSDTEYQTLGDGSTILISTQDYDYDYDYDYGGYSDAQPYEPPAPAQYGTFVGPDSYCANEDCSVLINYTDEQPGSYGYDSDVNSATFVPDTVLEEPSPGGSGEGFSSAEVVTVRPQFGSDLTDEQVNLVGNRCLDLGFDLGSHGGRNCLGIEADNLRDFGTLIPLDDLPGEYTGVDSSGESFIKDVSFAPDNNANAPVDDGWSIFNPSSWPIWGTEASAKPTRQFSTAVPFSGELFNQSLAAGAFGAFLLKDEQKDAPARSAREPFGNGL